MRIFSEDAIATTPFQGRRAPGHRGRSAATESRASPTLSDIVECCEAES
jgi:hypothetical protein